MKIYRYGLIEDHVVYYFIFGKRCYNLLTNRKTIEVTYLDFSDSLPNLNVKQVTMLEQYRDKHKLAIMADEILQEIQFRQTVELKV